MKNLFNNPWFVVALGLFALGYLGYTVGAPLFSQDAQAVGDDTPGLAGPGLSMDAKIAQGE